MKAVRLHPGPKGYAVVDDGNEPLATHLTLTQALRLVRGDMPLEEKYKGNSPIPRSDYSGRRVPRRTRSHNIAQAPWDRI